MVDYLHQLKYKGCLMAIAYSYIRFSSDKQTKGDSLRRQKALIQKWSLEHSDIQLSGKNYRDLGVSGFTGKNRTVGEWGILLKAVEEGHIKTGDYLLIESFDRAGRLPVEEMIPALLRIIAKGITIVTLEDEQYYNKKSVGTHAIYTLAGKCQQAHNYSKQLSERVRKARTRTRDKVRLGKVKKLSTLCPWWMVWDKRAEDWVTIPEKIKIVELIFEMYRSGNGITKITRFLNQNYPNGFEKNHANIEGKLTNYPESDKTTKLSRGWHTSAVNRCLFDRRVLGEVTSKGDQLSGYYPPVISISAYKSVIDLRTGKSLVSNKTKEPKQPFHLFHDLVYCSCGESCTLFNKGRGVFMYTCKKRIRGLCNASTSLNSQLVDIHMRRFIYEIEYDFLVKMRTPLPGEEDNILDDSITISLSQELETRKEEQRRKLNAYTSGVVMIEDEPVVLKELKQLNNMIRDLEMQIKEAEEQLYINSSFDIEDILNTEISGYNCNLFLKTQAYRIIINANGLSILINKFKYNGVPLELLRVQKNGKAVKGSESTTVFSESPFGDAGLLIPSMIQKEPKLFIKVDNTGLVTFLGDYLVNTGTLPNRKLSTREEHHIRISLREDFGVMETSIAKSEKRSGIYAHLPWGDIPEK